MFTRIKSANKRNYGYIMPLIFLIITGVVLMLYFAWLEYQDNQKDTQTQFAAEAERIERSLLNIVEHTEFAMKIMIMQIVPNYEDLNYIENILSKYSVRPNLHNALSWTVFAWMDRDLVKKVDSLAGVTVRQSSHGHREFLQAAKKYPERIQIGSPIFGFTSQRYIIPAAVGVASNGKFLGALTIGFDVVKLGMMLDGVVKDHDMYFALVDKNMDIILQSSNSYIGGDGRIFDIESFREFVNKHKIVFDKLETASELNVANAGVNHYLYRMPNLPFAIYLHYDNQIITARFWKEISFRLIEICVIGFVALVLVLYIYKREKILRNQAEIASKLAQEASQAKTDFLAYTAHELRSPLGFIITSSEMMISKMFGKINEKYLEYIRNIHQASSELVEFINDLLNEMRAQGGNFPVTLLPVNVEALLKRSIKINMMNYNHKISVVVHISKHLPNLISDHRRLMQVFNNVISNAAKYSPENSILDVTVKMKNKEMVMVFKDHGHGMSEEDLQISLVKYGVAKRDDNIGQSIGLGLPLIQHLLDALGGSFSIDSRLGSGTMITIIFPKNNIEKSAANSGSDD